MLFAITEEIKKNENKLRLIIIQLLHSTYHLYTTYTLPMFAKHPLSELNLAKVRKSVKLVDSTNKSFQVTSGELFLPFGVSSWENKYSDYNDYSVQCYVNKTEGFENFCEDLNAQIVDVLGKSSMFDTSNSEIASILKQNKDFPKLLKINLPRDRFGNFDFVVFDEDSNKIMVTENNVDNIFCKKRTFKCIFENMKVWEYNGRIGTIWNMVQAKYYKIQESNNATEGASEGTLGDESEGTLDGAEVDGAYTQCML